MYDYMLTDAERAVRNEARDFVKNDVPPDLIKAMDKDEIRYPREYVKKLGERNLLGLRFPKKYGGRDLPWTAEVAVEEEIGVLGTALGCAYVMPSIVGEAINTFGTDAQKEKYLVPLLKGDIVSAEALTEPRGGSDFFGATTKAVLDGDHFIVNGQKRFVVAASEADLFLVFCRTNFEKGADAHNAISALLIEKGPGVEAEYLYGLMGCRGGGTGRLVFRDVKVPKENLLGELNMGGLVFHQTMIPERLTSAAASLGVFSSLNLALDYSTKRVAFGRPIRKFQAIQFMIAEAITKLDAARALVYMAARAVDTNQPNVRRIVSEAKKFATEMGWEVVNRAMQVMGGIGYTDVYPIEKALRDTRLCMIWTGTSEIMNLLIQHEYYREVAEQMQEYRNFEADAIKGDDSEKCFTDDDMWRVHEQAEV
ncbi:MAG: acyl-CoA dehydrogenase family protein [Candidatus Abyssubacteria bacterium]